MQQKIIIAIDGYSSCGKSTLARQLARHFQYIYVDSGAMYRAVTLYFLQQHISIENITHVEEALTNIQLYFKLNKATLNSDIYLNKIDVEQQIRQMEISEKVSEVAAIKEVRSFAVLQQRSMGKNKGMVMDGRDIGTTVFPEAELKIFMTADVEIRVERRFKELQTLNKNITVEEVKSNIEKRDYIDTHRSISPLHKAADAVTLNNTHLTTEQQLAMAIQLANDKIKAAVNLQQVTD